MKKNKNEQLIERREIEGSPFIAVKMNNKWFLTMGQFRLSESEHDTFEEVLDYLEKEKWNIIGVVVGIIVETIKKLT